LNFVWRNIIKGLASHLLASIVSILILPFI